MPRHVAALLVILTAAALLAACGSEPARAPATDEPAAVAPGRGEASFAGPQLLEGGLEAFKARLAELRGRPIVVNQWASWCGPCRMEFPFLRDQALARDGEVEFIGVNSRDGRADAEAFLAEVPVPFHSYFDPDVEIAREFRGGRAWPTTAFYDERGRVVHTHLGAYATEAQLSEAIEEHLLDG